MSPLLRATVLATALLGAGSLQADDTELYVRNASTTGVTARANVLFIIDTSGSMVTQVETQAPYQAGTTYSGCFDGDAVYFSANGTRPTCGNADRFPKALNRCAASADGLTFAGFYSDAALGWNAGQQRWDSLVAGGDGRPVECRGDRGVDGDGSAARPFAADGADGPWSSSSTQEPAWPVRYTLYDGNWLNWNESAPLVERTRLQVVQSTVETFARTLRGVNVGVMRFNSREGGSVAQAVLPLEDTRDAVVTAVNALSPSGSTPLSETLFEAAQYFAGASVVYGNRDTRSVPASRVGGNAASNTYLTPASEPCSRNFIILLSDGEPADDGGADALITGLPGFGTLVGSGCDGSGQGRCLDDLAEYLYRYDLNPEVTGVQNVVTSTIGFDLDLPLLADTARRGGGGYYLANDIGTLTTALSGIVLSILDNAGSFAAPAIPVNAYNRATSSEDAYLAVFQASERARWPGNLKKYRLVNGVLEGRDGPALDPVTGFFSADAFSFWSPARDGDDIAAGGAASQLPAWPDRRLFTNLTAGNLAASGNAVTTGNTALTAALLGVPPTDREAVIEWARGRDVLDVDGDGDTGATRRDFGDPLHVQPVTLSYGPSASDPRTLVFMATNDGYLHAIDAETGAERWAFVPRRLLPQLYTLYRNEPAPQKVYGLDGEITLYLRNRDGQPGISDGDQAILLFGMGRGGRALFAVDVTDPDAPALLWEIDSGTPGFADIGQTWSRPVVTRVGVAGRSGSDEVVIVGGGHDPGQDNRDYRTDTIGNAVYMIGLDDGALLWSAGSPTAATSHDLVLDDMQHSIPAALRVLDLTRDGRADRMYVGDLGGRLWRFDILNDQPRATLVEGGVLASLGGAAAGDSPDPADLRRFYETPDVVPISRLGQVVITVNIGSGYRGRPLDTTIAEAFFSVRDLEALRVIPTADYAPPITVGDLVDVTTDTAPTLPADAAGWQLRLVAGNGEKVLGESLTIRNNVFFTSFTPGASASACVASIGTNRLYQVSLFDASPLTNLDTTTEELDLNDRFVELGGTSMALEPVAVFSRRTREDGSQVAELRVCVGMECRELTPLGVPVPTYWFPGQAPPPAP